MCRRHFLPLGHLKRVDLPHCLYSNNRAVHTVFWCYQISYSCKQVFVCNSELCKEARIISSLLLSPAGGLWLCRVTEKYLQKELPLYLGNVEKDIMDLLQVGSDLAMCSLIQFLYLVLIISEHVKSSSKCQERRSALFKLRTVPAKYSSLYKGTITSIHVCWDVLAKVSIVLQNSVSTSKRFLSLYLNSH